MAEAEQLLLETRRILHADWVMGDAATRMRGRRFAEQLKALLNSYNNKED